MAAKAAAKPTTLSRVWLGDVVARARAIHLPMPVLIARLRKLLSKRCGGTHIGRPDQVNAISQSDLQNPKLWWDADWRYIAEGRVRLYKRGANPDSPDAVMWVGDFYPWVAGEDVYPLIDQAVVGGEMQGIDWVRAEAERMLAKGGLPKRGHGYVTRLSEELERRLKAARRLNADISGVSAKTIRNVFRKDPTFWPPGLL